MSLVLLSVKYINGPYQIFQLFQKIYISKNFTELQEKACFLRNLCYTIKFVGFKQDRNVIRYIAGTVGAGDSFCAGILYAVYKKLSMNEALKIAVATAAANLSAEDSIGGLRNIEETMKLYDTYSPEK